MKKPSYKSKSLIHNLLSTICIGVIHKGRPDFGVSGGLRFWIKNHLKWTKP